MKQRPSKPAPALLERFGLEAAPWRFVDDSDCTILRITPPHGGVDFALRIYPADAELADVQTEIAWLVACQSDPDLWVPVPQNALDGSVLQTVVDGAGKAHFAWLHTWLDGRMHDRGLSAGKLCRLGQATARLHTIAEQLCEQGMVATRRPAFRATSDDWSMISAGWRERLGRQDLALIRSRFEALQGNMSRLSTAPGNHGLIHSDLHQWNTVYRGQRVGIFDFSDCGWGHHAYDMASALNFLDHPWVGNHDHGAAVPAMKAAFLGGYAAIRPLPTDLAVSLPICTMARMFGGLRWVLCDWPQPDARQWGPGFVAQVLAHLRSG
jgi:Ser/Thr protein kinase RdoA (MazF antagonist)